MLYKENAFKTITKRSKSGSTYKTYFFYCDCGSEIKAQSHQLKQHSGKCKSCCQKKRPYEHIYNELLKSKLKVTITFNEFLKIIENKKCHYCNKELFYHQHSRTIDGKVVSRAYQLDRKDNNLGYNINNVVSCCWECNRIKSNIYTYNEFIEIGKVLKKIR